MPFIQEKQDQIRHVAAYSLKGYKLSSLTVDETIYLASFRNFQLVAGLEYGDVYALPYEGGVFDQPYRTLMMWNIFKEELLKFIASEQKKQASKMKRR